CRRNLSLSLYCLEGLCLDLCGIASLLQLLASVLCDLLGISSRCWSARVLCELRHENPCDSDFFKGRRIGIIVGLQFWVADIQSIRLDLAFGELCLQLQPRQLHLLGKLRILVNSEPLALFGHHEQAHILIGYGTSLLRICARSHSVDHVLKLLTSHLRAAELRRRSGSRLCQAGTSVITQALNGDDRCRFGNRTLQGRGSRDLRLRSRRGCL